MFYASTVGGGAMGLVYRHQDPRRPAESFAVNTRRRDRHKGAGASHALKERKIISEDKASPSSQIAA